ncbi:MAG: hypothetical protein KKD01_19605 [Proteobacteria bacterium]|nr:hypothetical protein [Pseudomonadota bacterium]
MPRNKLFGHQVGTAVDLEPSELQSLVDGIYTDNLNNWLKLAYAGAAVSTYSYAGSLPPSSLIDTLWTTSSNWVVKILHDPNTNKYHIYTLGFPAS